MFRPALSLQSPAKINLHLRIGPLAPDRFHPLLSWMATVGFFDRLEFGPSKLPGIKLVCDRADLPVDSSNLIVGASEALRDAVALEGGPWVEEGDFLENSIVSDETSPGVEIHLQKNIPMGGGLGGGSSNAAFTMLGLNRFFNLHLGREHLSKIGAALGSDVCFFLHGSSAVCTGRGQFVKPIDRPRCRWVVLIFPRLSMPTPAVYRKFDEMNLGKTESVEIQPDWDLWTSLPALELLPNLVNDLEQPAFAIAPQLGELRAAIEQSLGRIVRMSGSGSTLFTLFDDQQSAETAATEVNASERMRSIEFDSRAVELAPQADSMEN
jgi:4-diphosphocytidyl-2-C-methyl-D-erythritol kinase